MRSSQNSVVMVVAMVLAGVFFKAIWLLVKRAHMMGLQTALRVLGEYSDVTATCKSLELDNGVVEYVDIEFDDIPSLQSFMVEESSVLIQWKAF